MLHLYGRFCNANQLRRRGRFLRGAGRREAPLPDRREPHRWCAASAWAARRPGTSARTSPGFGRRSPPARASARRRVSQVFRTRSASPTWEQKLWHLYDATDYAINFSNVPDGGLSRRDRPAEAGRRHDGAARWRRRACAWCASSGRRRRTATIPIPKSRSTASSTPSPNAAATPIRARSGSPPGRWPTTA